MFKYLNLIFFPICIIAFMVTACQSPQNPHISENNSSVDTSKKKKVSLVSTQTSISKNASTFNDTIFLGFVLRDSKQKTQLHIRSLIKQGKTKNVVTYQISLLGSSTVVGGYPYTMYFEGKKMETVFKPFFEDNKLYQIEIAMIEGGDSDYVIRAMNKKYGTGKKVEEGFSTSYKWVHNNTEIEVGTGGLFTITYTDLAKSVEIKTAKARSKKKEISKGNKDTNEAI